MVGREGVYGTASPVQGGSVYNYPTHYSASNQGGYSQPGGAYGQTGGYNQLGGGYSQQGGGYNQQGGIYGYPQLTQENFYHFVKPDTPHHIPSGRYTSLYSFR